MVVSLRLGVAAGIGSVESCDDFHNFWSLSARESMENHVDL